MDEDDAMIDACKVEHLISSETRSRLKWFLNELFSDKKCARCFMQDLKSSDREKFNNEQEAMEAN